MDYFLMRYNQNLFIRRVTTSMTIIRKMKKNLTLLLFINTTYVLYAQITICSWNLENFGKSKNDSTINFIANTVKDCDAVSIQEVPYWRGM